MFAVIDPPAEAIKQLVSTFSNYSVSDFNHRKNNTDTFLCQKKSITWENSNIAFSSTGKNHFPDFESTNYGCDTFILLMAKIMFE
jgi:hypothetical protein